MALLCMSAVSIAITNNAVVRRLKASDLRNLAGTISATIDGRIEKAVFASRMLAEDPLLMQWVASADRDTAAGKITEKKLGELVTDFGYDAAFLTSAVTCNYWSFTKDGFRLLDVVSESDPADDWFFTTLKMNRRYEINIDPNKELKETFVWINALVGDTQNPMAVTGIGMNLSSVIRELISEESANELENDLWLVNGAGIIYLSKNPEYLEQPLADHLPPEILREISSTDPRSGRFRIAEYRHAGHGLNDIAYKKIQQTDWTLIVRIPRSESLGFLNPIIIGTLLASLIILIVMVFMFNFISNRIANPYKRALQLNRELEEKVAERTRELQEKNSKIQDSIEYAKKIQETILPSDNELRAILGDYFVVWEPRDTVGGDFYWTKGFSDGFLMVVGDCTGHGVPGALMTMAVHAMLNRIVEDICHDDPAVILSELDRLLTRSFEKNGEDCGIHDGLDAGILFVSKRKKVFFSGAKLSLVVSGPRGAREIRGSRHTLEAVQRPGEKRFENHEVPWEPGCSLYLTTDGFIEQPGGEKHLPFGKSRLIAAIESASGLEMLDQRFRILDTFRKYTENEMIRDDCTIVGFKLGN